MANPAPHTRFLTLPILAVSVNFWGQGWTSLTSQARDAEEQANARRDSTCRSLRKIEVVATRSEDSIRIERGLDGSHGPAIALFAVA
jgi:hypothetical protein